MPVTINFGSQSFLGPKPDCPWHMATKANPTGVWVWLLCRRTMVGAWAITPAYWSAGKWFSVDGLKEPLDPSWVPYMYCFQSDAAKYDATFINWTWAAVKPLQHIKIDAPAQFANWFTKFRALWKEWS